MGELNIEKVDESKFVPPDQAVNVGYWGYTPDDTDDREYTVAVQGPLAEEANKPASEQPQGADKLPAEKQQAVKHTSASAKETTR